MAELMNQIKRTGKLKKAASEPDPADFTANGYTSTSAGVIAGHSESVPASANESISYVDNAGEKVSVNASSSANVPAIPEQLAGDVASISASANESFNTANSASFATSKTTSNIEVLPTGVSASSNTDEIASDKAISNASGSGSEKDDANAGKSSIKSARKKAGKKGGRTASPRRLGRPQGPERIALTVRILLAHDELITQAHENEGLSPQTVIEQALTEWAKTRNYSST